MAFLRDLAGGRKFPLEGEATVIGRDTTCDVRVRDALVSRRHAQIVREGPAFFVEDLTSANGTRVNGVYITEPTRLRPDDQIEVPGLVVTFQDEDAPDPAAPGGCAVAPDPPADRTCITSAFDARALRVEVAP